MQPMIANPDARLERSFCARGLGWRPRLFTISPAVIILPTFVPAQPGAGGRNKSRTSHRNRKFTAYRWLAPPGRRVFERPPAGGPKRFHRREFHGLDETGQLGLPWSEAHQKHTTSPLS